MRKKRSYKLIILLFIMLISMVCFLPKTHANADVRQTISETEIDSNLYYKLKSIAGGWLYTDSFIKERADLTTLDLSNTRTQSKGKDITDISGLAMLRLDNITTLKLSHNSITSIPNEVILAMPKLETLIVDDNKLTELDLSNAFNLTTVIANNNKLTNAYLSDITATNGEIDLSANYLSSLNDIQLPYRHVENEVLKLYNNNISDLDNFTLDSEFTVYAGLQGLQSDSGEIERKQTITYYKANDASQLKIVIKSGDNIVKTIYESEVTNAKTIIDLPIGSYSVEYYYVDGDEDLIISTARGNYAYDASYLQTYFPYYTYCSFDIIPTTPTYKFIVNGVTYNDGELSKITKKCTISVSADNDATIYYRLSTSGEWKEGREIPITHGGRYTIEIKAVTNNYSSKTTMVIIDASANLTLPNILLVVIIIIVMLLVGFVGVPLLKKYVL